MLSLFMPYTNEVPEPLNRNAETSHLWVLEKISPNKKASQNLKLASICVHFTVGTLRHLSEIFYWPIHNT